MTVKYCTLYIYRLIVPSHARNLVHSVWNANLIYEGTVLLYYCTTVLLYYCITVLLYYCIIVLLYYCITVLLYYMSCHSKLAASFLWTYKSNIVNTISVHVLITQDMPAYKGC